MIQTLKFLLINPGCWVSPYSTQPAVSGLVRRQPTRFWLPSVLDAGAGSSVRSFSPFPCSQTQTMQNTGKITTTRTAAIPTATRMSGMTQGYSRIHNHIKMSRTGRNNHGCNISLTCSSQGQNQTARHQPLILSFGHPSSGRYSSCNAPRLASFPRKWRYPRA